MNCEVCQLKELEVESFEIREVLRCILHTIVFHRALGLIRPKEKGGISFLQVSTRTIRRNLREIGKFSYSGFASVNMNCEVCQLKELV
jgi:hypothetical protein